MKVVIVYDRANALFCKFDNEIENNKSFTDTTVQSDRTLTITYTYTMTVAYLPDV